MRAALKILALALLPVFLGAQSCSVAGSGSSGRGGDQTGGTASAAAQSSGVALTALQVQQVIAQAAGEAAARSVPATIAVVDRVGNVLAVFRMTGAPATATVTSQRGVTGGLENAAVPATAAAIAKAVTGAYLSSGGNAFSTRTASQIIQEHFNPGELNQPGGPLFGVQFSQLPCSDLSTRFASDSGGAVSTTLGPKRSPLGLAGDPGGLPLYINGILVGGIGVMADGIYGLDADITNTDSDVDELIALAGTQGFAAPPGITAPFVSVDGRALRFTDVSAGNLASVPGNANFGAVNGALGALVSVTGYYAAGGGALAGTAFGTPASGIRADNGATFTNPNGFILVDGTNSNRYAPRAGTNAGAALTAAEVTRLLDEALTVALAARAQIRRPLDSPAQVTITVVDTNGVPLGIVRTPDAPVFGTDVSLQKARAAAFFSAASAATELTAAGLGAYVADSQAFFGQNVLNGSVAFANRSVGNIARPFFPDGILSTSNGPLSKPFAQWSPFADGLQLDLVAANIVTHLGYLGSGAGDTPNYCTALPLVAGLPATTRGANGFQIFPGSVPIYRGSTLIGGIGVSGDGIDQDDMISFLGLHNAGVALGTVNNAPTGIRADTLVVNNTRLRYVSCPFQPFLNSGATNVCDGK